MHGMACSKQCTVFLTIANILGVTQASSQVEDADFGASASSEYDLHCLQSLSFCNLQPVCPSVAARLLTADNMLHCCSWQLLLGWVSALTRWQLVNGIAEQCQMKMVQLAAPRPSLCLATVF